MNIAEVTQWLVLNGFHKVDGSPSPDGEVIVMPGCDQPHWSIAEFPNVDELFVVIEPGDGSNLSLTVDANGNVESVCLGETHSAGYYAEADDIGQWGVDVLPELIKALRFSYMHLISDDATNMQKLKQALGSCSEKLTIQQEYFQ